MKRGKTIVMLFLFVLAADELKAQAKRRPNILFILSDDHAVNAIGCYNKRLSPYVKTPNIDQLAEEGMLFTQAFCTNSICSPSRATMLTGKYSHKNGVYCLNQELDPAQPTIATLLQTAGYQTAVYGKWHLVSKPAGFDDYKVLDEQGQYMNPSFFEKGRDSMVVRKGWVDDITEQMTEDFIRNRDTSKPFLVMLHYKSVHDPWETRPPYDTGYQHIDIPEPFNLCDTYENRGMASKRTTLKLEGIDQKTYRHKRLSTNDTCAQRKFIYQQFIKSFLRGANVLDENVGKIVQFIKELGLDNNTIIVYSSDQGHFLGEHGFFSKRLIYEESMQMPLIIRYPANVLPGAINNDLVANVDLAPTLLEMVGIKIPADIQGASLLPLLQQKTPAGWRKGVYYRYWQHLLHRDVAAHYGIRTKRYKLIYFYGMGLGQTQFRSTPPEWELYDLEKDPTEMKNLYGDPVYAPIIRQLKKQMLELKRQYDDEDDKYPELMEANKNISLN